MDYTIRLGNEHDLSELLRLESLFATDRISRHSFVHLFRRGHAEVWVAEGPDRLLGSAVVFYHARKSMARLYSLVVDPAARRNGVGCALLQACEGAARVRGRVGVVLEVWEDNQAALTLYKKNGYHNKKRILDYYEDGTAAFRLLKYFNSSLDRAES